MTKLESMYGMQVFVFLCGKILAIFGRFVLIFGLMVWYACMYVCCIHLICTYINAEGVVMHVSCYVYISLPQACYVYISWPQATYKIASCLCIFFPWMIALFASCLCMYVSFCAAYNRTCIFLYART